ncbi:hypothetical protein pb186bvf_016195 [Paramecium bursaria]
MFLSSSIQSEEESDIDMPQPIPTFQPIPIPPTKEDHVIIKNTNFHKNLGQNGARYTENDELDIEKLYYEQEIQQEITQENNSKFYIDDDQEQDVEAEPLEFLQIQLDDIKEESQEEQQEEQLEMDRTSKINYQSESEQVDIDKLITNIPMHPYGEIITQIKFHLNLRDFITRPYEIDGMFQLSLIRDRNGINRIFPRYQVYWGQNQQFLMQAKKDNLKGVSKYTILESQKDDIGAIGRVIQNDKNPNDYQFVKLNNSAKNNKQILGQVIYLNEKSKYKKPRNMKFALHEKNQQMIFESKSPQLKFQFNQNQYTLNFYGRVSKPSVKNCQLLLRGEEYQRIYFLFGKMGEDEYALDFRSPITPLIALQLALTQFDVDIK